MKSISYYIPDIHSLLISIFTLVIVAAQVSDLPDDTMNMFKALGGLVCLAYIFLYSRNKYLKKKIVIYGFLMSIFLVTSILYNENARFVNVLWVWSFLGAGAVLFEGGISNRVAKYTFYITVLFFLYYAISKGVSAGDILGHGSQNQVSILCIFAMFLFYLPYRDLSRPLPYIPTFIVLFLSIWTGNRSGILTCALFFFLQLRINWKIEKSNKKLIYFLIPLFLVVIVAIWFFINYISLFDEVLMSKMDKQGTESQRTVIWAEYLSGIFSNIGDFLFGPPGTSSQYPVLSYYHGNAHNLLFVLHSKFGLLGFVFITRLLVKSYKRIVLLKDKVMKCLFILVFFRSMFDWMAFPGFYDVIYWFLIFYGDSKLRPKWMLNSKYIG